MDSNSKITIYIYLQDEGVDCWRPTFAIPLGNERYLIEEQVIPEDEKWQFLPGQIVRCEQRIFSGGSEGLVAVEAIS
jgi:hypothetical protein